VTVPKEAAAAAPPRADNDTHPLATKRMGVALGLLALPALGITLMTVQIFAWGALLSLAGGAGIIWVYHRDIRSIRLRLVDGRGVQHLSAELWAALLLAAVTLITPTVVYVYLGATHVGDHDLASYWPPLTDAEKAALNVRLKAIKPQPIWVACETVNCRDLADGFGAVFKDAGWPTEVHHYGGYGVTGVSGLALNPVDDTAQRLKEAIEGATQLKVSLGLPRGEKDNEPLLLVVGIKPF
jgi:hypothetical protein